MNFLARLWFKLNKKLIGQDEFGNLYYESRCKDWAGRNKRSVLYRGMAEASKVPARWFVWLHHQAKNPPTTNAKKYTWEKPHLPNLTGTVHAYFPPLHLKSGKRDKTTLSHYQPWRPT